MELKLRERHDLTLPPLPRIPCTVFVVQEPRLNQDYHQGYHVEAIQYTDETLYPHEEIIEMDMSGHQNIIGAIREQPNDTNTVQPNVSTDKRDTDTTENQQKKNPSPTMYKINEDDTEI